MVTISGTSLWISGLISLEFYLSTTSTIVTISNTPMWISGLISLEYYRSTTSTIVTISGTPMWISGVISLEYYLSTTSTIVTISSRPYAQLWCALLTLITVAADSVVRSTSATEIGHNLAKQLN